MTDYPLEDPWSDPPNPARPGFWAVRGSYQEPDVPPPSLGRWYETTVVDDRGSGGAFRIVAMPADVGLASQLQLGVLNAEEFAARCAESLELERGERVFENDLFAALLGTRPDLAETYTDSPIPFVPMVRRGARWDLATIREWAGVASNDDPRLASFVARAATEPLVAIEGSPIRGVSLAALTRSAGTTAWVAYSGWTDHPYLLLAIPVGVVIMGGARGIAAGLEDGLYRVIVRKLTGQDPDASSESYEAEEEEEPPEHPE